MIQFGTGGFRGIIGDDFTKGNVKLIGEGIASIYKEKAYCKPIYIGYDYRFLSFEASRWIAETLYANGIKVIASSKPTTTPEIMYISKAKDSELGIMITASHNPYFYNGVKLFQKEGMDASKELTNKLESEIASLSSYKSLPFEDGTRDGSITFVEILNSYIDNISRFLVPLKNKSIKVLVDPIFGTGSLTLEKMLTSMGIENLAIINNGHDAFFGGMMPNPTKENVSKDKDKLLAGGYDVLISTDSDCDRLGVLDEKGDYVDANEILAALYYYLVKYRGMKGDIVKNLATSNLIDALAYELGYECHEVDVGFKNISAAMKKYNALIGGESSGGLTIRGYIYGKDSTFSSALFLEMISNIGKPLSKIIKEVKDFANFHHSIIEDHMDYKDKEEIFDATKDGSPNFSMPIRKKEWVNNNVKYRFDDGSWALLRFSGTEKTIRIFVEMPNGEEARSNVESIKEFVREIDK